MKMILSLLIAFGASVALAQQQDLSTIRKAFYEKLEGCGQAVTSDDHWMTTSLPDTANGIGHIRAQSLTDANKSMDLPAADTVVDVKIHENQIFVLTETTLEAWDLTTFKSLFKYASHPGTSKASGVDEKAHGFVLSGTKAVIAHGSVGIVVLDLLTGKVDKVIPMTSTSSAQDLDFVNASTLVVAVDNLSEVGFVGLYIVDLNSLSITSQIPVDNAMPFSVRVRPDNTFMVGYINAIWKFDAQALSSRSGAEARPLHRSWQFPGLSNVDMRGKTYYDTQNMYSCFYNTDGESGAHKGTPLVFKLSDLGL